MSPVSRRGLLKSSTALLLAAGTNSLFLPAARAAAQGADIEGPAFTFTHPGLLHSAADLARMKSAVDGRQSPVYDGFLALTAHSRSQTARSPPGCSLAKARAPTGSGC